jgi:hypothetical protein
MHMPLGVEIKLTSFLGRRYFHIPESAFVFLFAFDFTSYVQRKNPYAVLRAFEEVCKGRPSEDLCLVIKVKAGKAKEEDYRQFRKYISGHTEKVLVIDELLNDNEMKNLLRCCDSFVSLHRSEGFGLGLISAMFLGKPVVGTGYSGNMDFMSEQNSCIVQYTLCDVPAGAYPFWEGQVWAEPDVTHAASHMLRLVSEKGYARTIGEIASRHIRVNFSCRATGLRYLDRINSLLAGRKPISLIAVPAATGLGTITSLSDARPATRAREAASAPRGYIRSILQRIKQKLGSADELLGARSTALQMFWRLYNYLSAGSRSALVKLYLALFGRA